MNARNVLVALATVAVASQCSDFPTDGSACPASICTDRGTCTYQSTYPTCACSEGYTGVACTRCAEGFHRDATDSCVADEQCSASSCAATGSCAVELGKVDCSCQLGFGGLRCDSCRAGYHSLDDGGCGLDEACRTTSCSQAGTCSADGGRVSCECAPGHTGSACQIGTATCAMNDPCSTHGSCSERDGVVSCRCEPGFTGPTCAECYPGYAATDAGTCVLSEQCVASSCSFAGTCSADGGRIACACDPGYEGSLCSTCATGFHRASDFTCVADETCAGTSRCGANGNCVVTQGTAGCACAAGYAGLACERCYAGYHAEDGGAPDGGTGCVLDSICRPETCRFHGTCIEDGGSSPSCQCDVGFGGSNCQNNIDDCVNSACGAGRCVDLVDSYVCLCDGGVYGQVCP